MQRAVAVIWDERAPRHLRAVDAVETEQEVGQVEAELRNEQAALLALRGQPHVVRAFAACFGRPSDRGETFFTLQERCTGGDLLSAWEPVHGRWGGRLDDGFKLNVMRDLCEALVEIHRSGRVHLDLKMANVLLNASGGAKVGDFGCARSCDQEEGAEGLVGTPGHISPEAVNAWARRNSRIERTPKDDVFALGVIFHCLEYVELPFFASLPDPVARLSLMAGLDDETMAQNGLGLPERIDDLGTLIRAMLAVDPARRPDAEAVREAFLRLYPVLTAAKPVEAPAPSPRSGLPTVGLGSFATKLRARLVRVQA